MDYEFLRDVTGQVIVRFSMGHEVIGQAILTCWIALKPVRRK
jgi:uncharacterized protein YacL (UPF0231 family)